MATGQPHGTLGAELSVHRRGGKLAAALAGVSLVGGVALGATVEGMFALYGVLGAVLAGMAAKIDHQVSLRICEHGIAWRPDGGQFAIELRWEDIATVEARPSPLHVQWLAVTTTYGTDHVIPASLGEFRALQASLESREPRLAAMLLPAAQVIRSKR